MIVVFKKLGSNFVSFIKLCIFCYFVILLIFAADSISVLELLNFKKNLDFLDTHRNQALSPEMQLPDK